VSNIRIYVLTDRHDNHLFFDLNENIALLALSYKCFTVALNLQEGVTINPKYIYD
jgi:hypothetical protein